MKEVPPFRACDRKTDRCPLFQKAAGRRRVSRSSLAESFPPHPQFLAKFLTSAPINFYLCAPEVRVEILHSLGCFFGLTPWRVSGFQLYRYMRVAAITQFICEQTEEHEKIPVRQRIPQEEQRASQGAIHAVRE